MEDIKEILKRGLLGGDPDAVEIDRKLSVKPLLGLKFKNGSTIKLNPSTPEDPLRSTYVPNGEMEAGRELDELQDALIAYCEPFIRAKEKREEEFVDLLIRLCDQADSK